LRETRQTLAEVAAQVAPQAAEVRGAAGLAGAGSTGAGCAPARPMRASGLIKELADESMRRVSPGCLCVLPLERTEGRRACGQRLSPLKLSAARLNPIA
jgi:hypothetical protein